MYFPGNYRWSVAFLNMLSLAPYGASDIRGLYTIGCMLKDKAPDDDEVWFHAGGKITDVMRGHAERFDKSGRPVSAAHAYLRTCNYYQMAERFRTPKEQASLDVYRTSIQCFHRHAALSDLKIEILEVPYEGTFPAILDPRRIQRQNSRLVWCFLTGLILQRSWSICAAHRAL